MSSPLQSQAQPSPELVLETLSAYERTAALRAAIELDLFRAIGDGPGNVASLARQCSASPRGIRILCDFLVINGLLAKDGDRYSHTPTSGLFLDPRSPACLASISKFLGTAEIRESFDNLAEIVRTGRTMLPGDGTVEPENPVWVEFARSMAPMMAPVAPGLAKVALEGSQGAVKVLDVAAGHGLFGIAIAQQNPAAQIVALDWGPVLAVAEENAVKAGVRERFSKLPGSAFDVDYGGPYDVVLLTNFLHHFDVPTCTTLLKKVHAALKPGGRVVTLEFVPNPDRVSPPTAAGFSMIMLVSTVSGDAWTFSELEAMYKAAGLESVAAHPLGPETAVTGIRPR
ncbi:MAG TPA: class I SAM-dependent methyltransferase [Bryobacteraceae bacterium]|jgi:2-polyprenyl-3-methyl-5-hydroxy-6-metoxy-1,4-benzoquinol methylase|nr:class I SAM-dependent methyltransferase [Bryobacteraceae bacterium]